MSLPNQWPFVDHETVMGPGVNSVFERALGEAYAVLESLWNNYIDEIIEEWLHVEAPWSFEDVAGFARAWFVEPSVVMLDPAKMLDRSGVVPPGALDLGVAFCHGWVDLIGGSTPDLGADMSVTPTHCLIRVVWPEGHPLSLLLVPSLRVLRRDEAQQYKAGFLEGLRRCARDSAQQMLEDCKPDGDA